MSETPEVESAEELVDRLRDVCCADCGYSLSTVLAEKLVEDTFAAIRQQERERCAVALEAAVRDTPYQVSSTVRMTTLSCAASIRALGEERKA